MTIKHDKNTQKVAKHLYFVSKLQTRLQSSPKGYYFCDQCTKYFFYLNQNFKRFAYKTVTPKTTGNLKKVIKTLNVFYNSLFIHANFTEYSWYKSEDNKVINLPADDNETANTVDEIEYVRGEHCLAKAFMVYDSMLDGDIDGCNLTFVQTGAIQMLKRFVNNSANRAAILKKISILHAILGKMVVSELSVANFYATGVYNTNDIHDSMQKIYKNTFYASLYSEYKDYALATAAIRANFFVSSINSINGSASFKNTEGSRACATDAYDPDDDDEFEADDDYLEAFGPYFFQSMSNDMLAIRFKPGYLPFFREFRSTFCLTRRLKTLRHIQLTHYVSQYKRLTNAAMLKHYTFALFRVLVLLKFSDSYASAEILIADNQIFVNGVVCLSKTFQIQSNDIVALSANYFNYAFVLAKIQNVYSTAFSFYRRIIGLENAYEEGLSVMDNTQPDNIYKEVMSTNVIFIEKIYSQMTDIPQFFEVDFLGLSAVALYEPDTFYAYDSLFIQQSAFPFIKMVN